MSTEGKKQRNIGLRIAMLGHKRIPSREGGVEIVVEELSTRMAALGNSVTVFNRRGHNVAGKEYDSSVYNKKQFTYHGVNVKSVPTINHKGLAAVSSSFFACVKAAFGKYDVVHIHAEGPAYFCVIPHLLGKRVVVTIHGLDWQRAKWGGFASKFIKAGEKHAVKYADEIIVLSESVQDYFKKTYGRDTVFIPNGVNRPEIVPAQLITDKYGLTKNSYVLNLGRIVPEKGIHYLINAWKGISTDKKLVIAGGASDSDEYMGKLCDLAKDDNRIVFTGFTQGQELEELYSNAYVYVLPSDLEGMPLSLLEAMSYGNCCLTSDIDECASVIEGHGATFIKSDVDDLKFKLNELLNDTALVEKYKSTATDFICDKYSWDEVVKRTLELYRK